MEVSRSSKATLAPKSLYNGLHQNPLQRRLGFSLDRVPEAAAAAEAGIL